MSTPPNTPSSVPAISAGIVGLLLFLFGLVSCRHMETESRWLGLFSERVDKGPDWFSILLLVGGGYAVTYLIAKVAVSPSSQTGAKPPHNSNRADGQPSQPQPAVSPASPTATPDELSLGLRGVAFFGLLLIRYSESDVWKLCGWLAAGLSCFGLVIHHWKHRQNGRRDVIVIALSVIAILVGFAWALN
jgi:hypothetical protein